MACMQRDKKGVSEVMQDEARISRSLSLPPSLPLSLSTCSPSLPPSLSLSTSLTQWLSGGAPQGHGDHFSLFQRHVIPVLTASEWQTMSKRQRSSRGGSEKNLNQACGGGQRGATPHEQKLAGWFSAGDPAALTEGLKQLKDAGVDVSVMKCLPDDKFGGRETPITSLMKRAAARHCTEEVAAEMIATLLLNGHNPNEKSAGGAVPLVSACALALPAVLKVLLAWGARLDVRASGEAASAGGETCLGACIERWRSKGESESLTQCLQIVLCLSTACPMVDKQVCNSLSLSLSLSQTIESVSLTHTQAIESGTRFCINERYTLNNPTYFFLLGSTPVAPFSWVRDFLRRGEQRHNRVNVLSAKKTYAS